MNFKEKVYKLVKKIPKGRVMTYKEVAWRAGRPKSYRAVGNILHFNPDPKNIPCHRVVNSKGAISENYAFGGAKAQYQRLKKEGISFIDKKRVNLK